VRLYRGQGQTLKETLQGLHRFGNVSQGPRQPKPTVTLAATEGQCFHKDGLTVPEQTLRLITAQIGTDSKLATSVCSSKLFSPPGQIYGGQYRMSLTTFISVLLLLPAALSIIARGRMPVYTEPIQIHTHTRAFATFGVTEPQSRASPPTGLFTFPAPVNASTPPCDAQESFQR